MDIIFELTRPLISLDVETSGLGTPEETRIIELGFRVDYPDLKEPKRWCKFIDPGVPIAPAATEVHGITQADLDGAYPFCAYAENIAKGFTDCDFAGYHVHFDLRVLQAEFARCHIEWSYSKALIFDSLRIWQIGRPRHLTDAVREHLNREPTSAHRALGDAEDALEAGMAMVKKYGLPVNLKELHDLCFPPNPNRIDAEGKLEWKDNDVIITFGKHKGKPLQRVPREYLEWVCLQNFSNDVKKVLLTYLSGKPLVRSMTDR